MDETPHQHPKEQPRPLAVFPSPLIWGAIPNAAQATSFGIFCLSCSTELSMEQGQGQGQGPQDQKVGTGGEGTGGDLAQMSPPW